MTGTYRTRSAAETRSVAQRFASALKPGDIVALYGELGTGKTQFVKGLCNGLGVQETVASPTFVLVHRYLVKDRSGNEVLIHHLDLYRVGTTAEILDLGYDEIFFGSGYCIVEWADRLAELIPPLRYDIKLEWGEGEEDRVITIERVDGRGGVSP